MNSTKEQREGFARFVDTVAASAFLGGILGLTGRSNDVVRNHYFVRCLPYTFSVFIHFER